MWFHHKTKLLFAAGLILFAELACTAKLNKRDSIIKTEFGQLPDGRPVSLYTLTNINGCEMKIMNYGCIVVSLKVPDRMGQMGDVVLGYDNLDDYIENSAYFGAVVGRFGNRIGGAKFSLDGVEYSLAANDGENHLHGGLRGFDKVFWEAEQLPGPDGPAMKFTYVSSDGEEGYPGNLSVEITYALTQENGLKIDYLATTDKKTIINLTHHSYFNLAGEGNGDILGHEMTIDADLFISIGSGLIPTGELRSVKGSPLDFIVPTAIGARIDDDDEQLRLGLGYDHCWVLNMQSKDSLNFAARVYEPTTGRIMELYTTEPGLQFYSGNFLDGSAVGKAGKPYAFSNAFPLAAQH